MWRLCFLLLTVILGPDLVFSKPAGANSEKECGECCQVDFDNCPVKEGPKDKVIVCYYARWARGRAHPAHFTAKDIDPSLCTHVSYAFSILDPTTLTITEWSSKDILEVEKKTYEEITNYRSKGLTVIMSIGGGEDSLDGDKWSRMIGSDTARAKFVQSALAFLEKYKFDGLDVAFSTNKPVDKEKYTKLISELKSAFNGKFLLSIFGTSNIQRIEKSYDMASLCQLVDWINMGSYEYHSSSDETTGPQAPICKRSLGFGVYDAVKYYLDDVHCPPEKVVLGVAFFASTYTLMDGAKPQYGAPAIGPGLAGPHLKMAGYLTYYEVCQFVNKDGWTKGTDKINGDFIYKDNQLVSSPTIHELSRKACLVKLLNIKGINLWTMDYDDVYNVCECGNYPLLKTLNKHLRGLQTDIQCY